MPPPMARVASFSVDIEDWHSCTPSDDDAYQEALERNSNASFFTCRTHAPSSAVSAAPNEPESPNRLQDAEAALAGLVPESLSEAKLQHAAPALEPSDTPAAKKTKSAALPPTAPAAGAPRSKPVVTRRTTPLRSASARATTSPCPATAAGSGSATSDADTAAAGSDAEAALVRVHIIPRPDDTGVQLQILPSVLCLFGSVPFPAPSASSLDFAAALLLQAGGRSEAVSSAGGAVLTPAASVGGGVAAVGSPAARAALPLQTSEGGASAAGEDPIELKDQSSKARRGVAIDKAADKAIAGGGSGKDALAAGLDPRKSQAAFPGSMLLKRIFSGFSNNTNSMPAASAGTGMAVAVPPPASVQELGAELLAARGCGASDVQLAGAAAASATVVAGYVQAAAAGTGSVPASPGAGIAAGTADAATAEAEAAAAVHRMSTDIFRNVLRASGGGGGADVASPGKALRSPRDTAFLSAAAAAKAAAITASPRKRDQAPAAHAADTGSAADGGSSSVSGTSGKRAQAATPARAATTAVGESAGEGSPCKDEQSAPGVAALALLAGLAAPPAPQVPAAIRTGGGAGLAAAGSLEMLAPGQSGDMSEGGGLPMPDLEKCESPVMAKAAAAGGGSKAPGGSPAAAVPLAAVASEEVADAEEVTLSVAQEPDSEPAAAAAGPHGAPVSPVPTTAAAVAVSEAGATASPRTVSKKAYGTVANVVRKMVPGFRDSALMALASSTEGAAAPAPPPPRPPVAPRVAKAPAGPKVAAPLAAAPAALAGLEAAAPEAKEVPQEQSDSAVQSPGAPMFIFGQEQPKTAKTPVIRPRPISAKPAASPAGGVGEPTTPVDAAGRKRKSELEDLPIAKMPVSSGKTASTNGVGVISPGDSTALEAPSPSLAATAAAKSAAQVPVEGPARSAKQAEAAAPKEIVAEAINKATEVAPQAEAEPVRAQQPLRHSVTSEIEEVTSAPEPVPAAQPVAPAAQAQPSEAQSAAKQPSVKPAAAGTGKKPSSGGLFACFGCFKA